MTRAAEAPEGTSSHLKNMPKYLIWLLLLLWLQFFYAIHFWWSVEGSYYEFGWIVPPAAVWFFWQRSLVPPATAFHRSPARPGIPLILAGCAVVAGVIFLRFVERSYLFWRLPVWLHAFLLVAVHHGVLLRYRYPPGFAWITLFALTAVPLPSFVERVLVDQFTDLVMRATEIVAHLQGLPVLRIGTALVGQDGLLDITEGCSGIRSFQGLAMVSLFCGEWFRLSFARRIALIAAGAICAFCSNTARTVILTWIHFQHGADAFDTFHDGVGTVTYIASVALTAAIAWLLRGFGGEDKDPRHHFFWWKPAKD